MDFSRYGETVAVSNSLRSYLNLETYHRTDSDVDQWLKENDIHRIAVLLVDALGTSVLKKHLNDDSFLLSHMYKSITPVFPPTTSASTTSIRTGKMPCETGWLGWNQYFKEKDDNIILFLNRSQYGNQEYPGFSYKALPVRFTEDELGEQGDSIWPGWAEKNACSTYEDMWKKIIETDRNESKKYVYAYWDQLDTLMHREGPSSKKTNVYVKQLDIITEKYASQLSEHTGLIILADHSQVDVHAENIRKHTELCSCFRHLPALEPRTAAFYIKEEKKDFFAKEFLRLYGNDFDLYTEEEVIDKQIFGTGKIHPRFEEFIGDYLAIAKGRVSFLYGSDREVKGDHAGGSEEEAMIPLILYVNKEKKAYE